MYGLSVPPVDLLNRSVDMRYRLFSYHTHNICILTYKLLRVKIAEQIVTKSDLTSLTEIQSPIFALSFFHATEILISIFLMYISGRSFHLLSMWQYLFHPPSKISFDNRI